jgi:fatty-acyl-CoA synthase
MLTHHNILNNAIIVGDNINLTHKDMLVANPPFFHCMGMVMTTLNAMQRGASVLLPSLGFDAEAALAGVAEEQATAILGVPTMFIQMLNHPSMKDLKPKLQSLRTGIMAGSVCPIELMRRVESELGIKELAICYGMTETSPVSTQTNHHGEHKHICWCDYCAH